MCSTEANEQENMWYFVPCMLKDLPLRFAEEQSNMGLRKPMSLAGFVMGVCLQIVAIFEKKLKLLPEFWFCI